VAQLDADGLIVGSTKGRRDRQGGNDDDAWCVFGVLVAWKVHIIYKRVASWNWGDLQEVIICTFKWSGPLSEA